MHRSTFAAGNAVKVLLSCQAKIHPRFFISYNAPTILKGETTMITNHALQRTHERAGLNRKSSARLIENAFQRGKTPEAFHAFERKYLKKKTIDNSRVIVYNSLCFIISEDDFCITVFQVPEWFGKKQYDGKQEIRDVKKYMRFNNFNEQEDTEYGLGKVS